MEATHLLLELSVHIEISFKKMNLNHNCGAKNYVRNSKFMWKILIAVRETGRYFGMKSIDLGRVADRI